MCYIKRDFLGYKWQKSIQDSLYKWKKSKDKI